MALYLSYEAEMRLRWFRTSSTCMLALTAAAGACVVASWSPARHEA
jgi:hypothetical protein